MFVHAATSSIITASTHVALIRQDYSIAQESFHVGTHVNTKFISNISMQQICEHTVIVTSTCSRYVNTKFISNISMQKICDTQVH